MAKRDRKYMERAIELALESEADGNIPVGAVVVLDGEIIGEGQSRVLSPNYHPGRHAEVEALRTIDDDLWARARAMTCYSTLEPCVMCAGTLLLHGVGRVVFGAYDELGGARAILDHLPPYYDEGGVFDWEGPLMPERCDELYRRAGELFDELPVGKASWTEPPPPLSEHLALLQEWVDTPGIAGVRSAQSAARQFADSVEPGDLEELLPYAAAIFVETGYLKDYRALKRWAKKAGKLEVLDEIDDAVLEHLPDVWIGRALDRGHYDTAIDFWFEHEDHRRGRHVADRLVRLCGKDRPDLVVSCRMSTINYLIGRKKRRFYRKAGNELRRLRDELRDAGAIEYWPLVLDDVLNRFGHLKALRDELSKAGLA